MESKAVSLPELLCQIYGYHVRLRNAFDAEVEQEVNRLALDAAISSGDSVMMLEARPRYPAKFAQRHAKLRDKAVRDAKSNTRTDSKRMRVNPMLAPKYSDRRYTLALGGVSHDAAKRIRKRNDDAGRPVEKANAWSLAVRWIGQRLDDGFVSAVSDKAKSGAQFEGVSVVEYYLDRYCRLNIVPMVPADGKYDQLAFAHDGIRRRALTRCEGEHAPQHFDIQGAHQKLWEERQRDPGYARLERSIHQLDKAGEGDKLLAEVWRLHSTEATEAPLPKPCNSLPIDGRGGAGAGDGQRGDEYTLAEASEKHDIPKSVWTKAAKLKTGQYGYLPTRSVGRNRFVLIADAAKFAKDYDARRDKRGKSSLG